LQPPPSSDSTSKLLRILRRISTTNTLLHHQPTNQPTTTKMRSFSQIFTAIFALLCAVAFAQEEGYDATVYITSTVYRVNTVTMSSSAPAPGYTPANSTSTISATHPTIIPSYNAGNGTSGVAPTASAPTVGAPSASKPAEFEGAAASIKVNTMVVALAAGVGYLVL
jgi:hypothetical protein